MSGLRRIALATSLLLILAPAGAQQVPPQPEGAPFAPSTKRAVVATRHMVAAANPLAAAAGREILRQGGSALDAAIAMQMVLNLVEPQSSGIGGGAFLVHYNATTKKITTYDGRETAPAGVTPEMFVGVDGKPIPFPQASAGGRAVGTPGLLRMLELAHKENGRLPWARNFEPAIRMAKDGFTVSPRLAMQIGETPQLRDDPAAAKYFFDATGEPRAAGTTLVNDELAETLRMIANGGADAFYKGPIARDVATAVQSSANPGALSIADLKGYQAVKREPVCGPYRAWIVCGMGPPSSGGIAVLQALTMLEPLGLKHFKPGSLEAVHLMSEATRLAFADRGRYLGDPEFVPVPVKGLLDRGYLQTRSKLIAIDKRIPKVEPGLPPRAALERFPWPGRDATAEIPATSHISVVDGSGNAVAMTTSLDQAFGSRVFVRGFLLNNQMTDFAFVPTGPDGPLANAVQPGKRPRSSMSPTIVTDRDNRLVLTLGARGGSYIIPFVIQSLVGVLDWNLDVQQAIALPRHATFGGNLDLDRSIARIAPALRELGWTVVETELPASSMQGIAVVRRGDAVQLVGGADPRREGEALGD